MALIRLLPEPWPEAAQREMRFGGGEREMTWTNTDQIGGDELKN